MVRFDNPVRYTKICEFSIDTSILPLDALHSADYALACLSPVRYTPVLC